MTKPKAAKAAKRKWKTLKEGIQMRGDGQIRIRLTKAIKGSDGKPKMVTSNTGKVRPAREEYIEFFDSKQKAIEALPDRKVTFKNKGNEPTVDPTTITFAELSKAFSDAHLFAPVYDSDPKKAKHEKLAGLAGYKDGIRAMAMFSEVFGNRPIRSIKADEIRTWKTSRFAVKKQRGGGDRSLTSVNRELSFLSKAFGYAVQKGWLDRNPFAGAKLINIRNEYKREIALTFTEEKKLLEVMADYPLLRMLFIFLLDTGLRIGEARKLERGMIKLSDGTRGHIYLAARITKGKEKRSLPVLTPRLRDVIDQRFAIIPNDPKALVFGDQSVRDEFDSARERAKLDRDIELRDTRHTWISRAVPSGIPLPEAMLYSGHKVVDTFLRYLQPSVNEHNANASRFESFIDTHQIQDSMASDQVN